jgi:hypothetical protein
MKLALQSSTKKSSPVVEFIWQDREIRFDVAAPHLKPRPGEKIVEMIT